MYVENVLKCLPLFYLDLLWYDSFLRLTLEACKKKKINENGFVIGFENTTSREG